MALVLMGIVPATACLNVLLAMPARGATADAGANNVVGAGAPVMDYNAGIRAYQAGNFLGAMQSFQHSIDSSPSSDSHRVADQEDAYYNLGAALYRAGQQLEQSDPPQAMQKWTEAVHAFDTALQLRADDADSQYNRDLISRKMGATARRLELNNGGQGKGERQDGGDGQGNTPASSQNQPPPPGPSQPQGAPRSQGQPQPSTPGDKSGQRPKGQLTPEEARELLDSDTTEEQHALTLLPGPRNPTLTPDMASKDW
jgi:tetratricopeptide (TPR) repeat protein